MGGLIYDLRLFGAPQKVPDTKPGGGGKIVEPKPPANDPCLQPKADPGRCPDADYDNDRVANRADQCATLAEDRDGAQDSDGCPELDNDGDGIADAEDKCPNEAGIV